MDWGGCLKDGDVATLNCIPYLFLNLARGFLLFAGIIAIIMIVYGGIRLITSGGNPKSVSSGRQILIYAIVGLIVVIISFAIVYFVGYLTNTTTCLESLGNVGGFVQGCQ